MPGLAAICMPKYDDRIANSIDEMAKTMCHEDFYKKDIFQNSATPFVAARVHLDIINRDTQPLYNQDKTLLIMMDGELHNPDELKQKLKPYRGNVQNYSDAELLLHLYEQFGSDFVYDLNGWMLVLIYDLKQDKVLIVNDRHGIYRAYSMEYENALFIASEIKCLLKCKNIPHSINERSIAEYFACNAVLDEKTMFSNIYRLPPASIWTYSNGILNKRQYFDPSKYTVNDKLSESDFLEQGNEILKKITPRYFIEGNVGMSLTGGWDTRTQVAVMGSTKKSIPCYTFSGLYRNNLDTKIAKRVADEWGQTHETISIGRDFLDNFAHYAYKTIYISDGTADIFKSHEIYLNKIARNIAPIRVTGKYGSQVLSSVFGLKKQRINHSIFSNDFLFEIKKFDNRTFDDDNIGSMINDIRWFWIGFLAIETSQLVVRTPFTDNDLIDFLSQVPMRHLVKANLQKYVIKKNYPHLALIPSDKGKFIEKQKLYDTLYEQFINVIIKLDKAYNWQNMPHILAKSEPIWGFTGLQNLIVGYNQFVNYRLWLKKEFRQFAQDILLDELTLSRPYYHRQSLIGMVNEHFSGKANYTTEIGKIISFEIWHRLFID